MQRCCLRLWLKEIKYCSDVMKNNFNKEFAMAKQEKEDF